MQPYYSEDGIVIHAGDCLDVLRSLPAESVQTCVTSPPYWGLRDYGEDGQLGLESTPEEYVAKMVGVFAEVRRVLRDDGTLWLNLGDCYATGAGSYRNPGSDVKPVEHGGKQAYTKDYARAQPNRMPIPGLKPKDLVGIPWRVAFALQADGWYLRSDIIWSKPNPMPESVTDRPTKAHEYLFLLSKSARYFYDAEAIKEGTVGPDSANDFVRPERLKHQNGSTKPYESTGARNRRTVWAVPTQPFPGAHFAVFPPKLIEPCIKAGAKVGDTVLDPFTGSGTTALVAKSHGCRFVGAELNAEYIELAARRLAQGVLPFGGEA